ncbi:DUF4982 domain-containing protein [Reichenbachiella agarivorans]|uniref:DUF4982 domain-containing protein n=1 Tax=Reichenbachiella agarivorans TaxID=2979464 RepID=A0ABY6CNU6_9BACT|nr:glycoside hydrolase family 2 TIM barrel-domain containing protein [Reichenbachiella agarivorans]UXP32044.1 DUF4982 domain-containing protein [Reichenbachiella agarivorans]
MNTKHILLITLIWASLYGPTAIAQDLPYGFPDTERSKENINQDWKFHVGDAEAEYYQRDLDDSSWETVNVPHTLALTSLTLDGLQDEKTQLVFHREVGWYRRDIEVPAGDQKVFLEFEGVHQVATLWVNGQLVGKHSTGGYTPFHFDITDYVDKGQANQITVLADNRRNELVPPDPGPFDYVKFSGLYRDVYLVQTDPVHVTFNWESLHSGVYITTPTIDPVNKNATINIKTAVRNEGAESKEIQLITRVIDADGLVVMKLTDVAQVALGAEYQFDQIGSLEDNVQLWDIDNPYLYRVNSVVEVDGQTLDFVENKIGLRKFELDPVRGFVLNGEPIELLGFNRHQQYPYIGDAVPNSLHYKDMLQFKAFGFNIMRTAHYPQDDALIDACDELGILVYEEAPSWISISTEEQWWQNFDQAAREMVRNHRNHPSVVMWGGGINHRGYVPRVHNTIKQEDPVRLTASQGARWTGWQASGLTDINANMLYGPFGWDRSEPIFAMEGRRGPAAVAPYKADVLMTGLIAWTAHAYYTFHPSHDKANDPIDRTRSGAMTIFRYARPETEWYKAELRDEPFVYIHEDWVAGTEEVTVYSNADEVELFLNGKSLGKSKASTDTIYDGLDHAPFHFREIDYRDGELSVKAYFADGAALETSKKTPEAAKAIRLQVDTVGRDFTADGSDILMVYAVVVDKNGTVVSGTDDKITFSVKGDATVIGDDADINANPMFTEYGVAPALIEAGTTPGQITIYAKAKGLRTGKATVELVPNRTDMIVENAEAIYDFQSERVDLGALDQLVQFGWNYWYGQDNASSSYAFKNFDQATVKVATASDEGVIRWLGEMNVIGKYGYAYGDGVIGVDDDGLDLIFDGLPAGTYRLKTWHHAPRSNSDQMDPNKEKLKSLTIHQLPYEKTLTEKSAAMDAGEVSVAVTEGKSMQYDEPGTSTVVFVSDGQSPLVINFNGAEGKGIWLNALELSEWKK